MSTLFILFILFLFIIILAIDYLFFCRYLVNKINNKKKIIEENFSYFNLEDLKNKYKIFNSKNNVNQELTKHFEENILYIENILLNEIKNNNFKITFSKFILIIFWYKNYLEKLKTLEINYFNFKHAYLVDYFKINNLNINFELKETISIYIKNIFGEITKKISNSKYKKIILNNVILKKISEIENNLEKLDNLIIDDNVKIDDFKKFAQELNLKIQLINTEVNFLNYVGNFIKNEVDEMNKTFISDYSKNKNIFISYEIKWKKDFLVIKKLLKEINENIDNYSSKKIIANIKEIKTLFSILIYEAKINLQSYLFIKKYEIKLENIVKKISNNNQIINEDISLFLNNKEKVDNIKLNLNTKYEFVINNFKDYVNKRKQTFKEEPPFYFLPLLEQNLKSLFDYYYLIEEINSNVKDSFQKVNNVNTKIYEINTLLLSIETYLNKFSKSQLYIFENKLNKLKKEISFLIEKIVNKAEIFSQLEIDLINNLYIEAKDLYDIVFCQSFKYFYSKELVLFLNRYINDKNFPLFDKLYIHLGENDFLNLLRTSHKILQIDNIYV